MYCGIIKIPLLSCILLVIATSQTTMHGSMNIKFIWYGHVERMDPTRLPKIMIQWKPEGRKKRGRPRRTWKDGIYTALNGRDLRMGFYTSAGTKCPFCISFLSPPAFGADFFIR